MAMGWAWEPRQVQDPFPLTHRWPQMPYPDQPALAERPGGVLVGRNRRWQICKGKQSTAMELDAALPPDQGVCGSRPKVSSTQPKCIRGGEAPQFSG